jgi:hypothetical protein
MRYTTIEEKFYGPEPTWNSDKEITSMELGNAYNWYNYFYDHKVAKKYVIDYLKSQKTGKEVLDRISTLSDEKFSTIGWTCRIVNRGGNLSDASKEWMKSRLQSIIYDAKPKEQSKLPGVNIQLRMAIQLDSYLAEFEDQLDKFIANGYKTSFKPYDWLRSKDVKGPNAARISSFYKSKLEEIVEVLENPDDQLKEAYSHMSKPELKRLLEFYTTVITDCGQISHNSKISRKPRAKKRKTLNQIVSKIKYKTQDDTFKIKSIAPTEFIGAMILWIFNTKTRKLGVYHASNPDGLNIKGTTILNYDEKKSIGKTIRKPEQILPNVTQGGKVILRNLMDDINSKETLLNGRINKDIVLLRATK